VEPVSEDSTDFQGGKDMSTWKQLWNGVWNHQTPQDLTIRWITETFGEFLQFTFVITVCLTVFGLYYWITDRRIAANRRKSHDLWEKEYERHLKKSS